MSVIGYVLSVYVQCRLDADTIFVTALCRKPAGNCVRRFGSKHRLWKIFGSSAAIMMLEMITMKNYWKMSDFSIFSVPYAYVDHSSYLADQLFVQNKVTMKFKREMAREDSPYCIIFCKVLKKDTERFEEALGKLENKMLLLGYGDYPDFCNEIAKIIDKETKARERR
jgi:hypothetical protein